MPFIVARHGRFFRGDDGLTGRELWKSDGTTTVQIADINPGAAGSFASELWAVGSHLYFLADDGVTGTELWRTADWQSARVTAAAVSDDGNAIAILQSGAVSVLRREAS